jgi:hypothetical protein
MAVWNMENDEHLAETRRTAERIIASLRQAADLAKRNEDQAKLQAQGLAQELKRAQQALGAMEQRAAAAEERALDAEEWLENLHQELERRVIEPLRRRTQDDPSSGR